MTTKVVIFPDYVGKEQPMTPDNYNKLEVLDDISMLRDRISQAPEKRATINLHAADSGDMIVQYIDPNKGNILKRLYRAIRG